MQNFSVHQFVASLRYQNSAAPTPSEVAKRLRFLERYPDQEVNILSYQDNPVCQCSNSLINAIQADANKNDSATYIDGQPTTVFAPFQAMGTILTIDDTPEAYTAMHRRIMAELFMFRGLSIVPTVIDGQPKLRVFFF